LQEKALELTDLYRIYLQHPSVQTDTRKLRPGDIFFALKGPHFNGNLFAEQALEAGASFAVIDEEEHAAGDRTILVEDVLTTLQRLAAFHRDQFDIPFIAITGSNGKTTTKELARDVLATTRSTYATEGNLNNHIGIPLTLLRIAAGTQMAVIEMGANHQHEIEAYCRIVRPTHGLITNAGKAHLEGFGGVEGVRKGKGELFDYLRSTGGAAFICRDFDYFHPMSRGIGEIIWYGTGNSNNVRGRVTAIDPFLAVETSYTGGLQTGLVGAYNLYNILAAVTIGKYFGVPASRAKEAVSAYRPGNSRSQLVHSGDNDFILDAYNANPSSMQAAIDNFAASAAPHKVLMLGAMMELGEESLAEHARLVELIGRHGWDQVVLVGGDFALVPHPYVYLPDSVTAGSWLRRQHLHGATILVKGSRLMAMEKILD
jgi:UDP-N-acetylmuramoyl-tripeptide--D-alanyl-D-alanine ligase